MMDKPINDNTVTIEVDGQTLQAQRGQMLIEATDQAGIYVPRFCYHKKLSIAANCRMCLVEVEKMPKPVPACATPIMDGMKVFTRSKMAHEAQKATMEFLLINHPLDCPICDQGGECELQDLSVGYGSDVSRYSEGKRVVQDKDIGPLVQTDLTRCIHCTRCVRFGEEIAGMRELGATGRGEDMRIGTYVEKAMRSELSGNVIDLCPVGALTSKPYRFTARAWELRQFDSIAPHDSVGSNIHVHVRGNTVKRVVPRENEAVNEVWISDRDRFSYQGLNSKARLTAPMIRDGDEWREVSWETALSFTVDALRQVLEAQGPERIGALVSPVATLEEQYLLQKLMRALGSGNIDHRLRQVDFSADDEVAQAPWLGMPLAELEALDAILLIGSDVRREQPLVNHRLRKAASHGGAVMVVNPLAFEFNYPLASAIIVRPSAMLAQLAGITRALLDEAGGEHPATSMLEAVAADATQREIAKHLREGDQAAVLLGNLAVAHPQYATLQALAGVIAELSGAQVGMLAEGANSCGAWLAGVVPHRGPGMVETGTRGRNSAAIFSDGLDACLLMNIEPDQDCLQASTALTALRQADLLISLSSFRSEWLERNAHVLLPIAQFAETSGSFVNMEGRRQAFNGVVPPPGEARPAWKVLRVLGKLFKLKGFDYDSSTEVAAEVPDADACLPAVPVLKQVSQSVTDGYELISQVPMYALDPLVRQADALQQTDGRCDGLLHFNPALAGELAIGEGEQASVRQGAEWIELPVTLDERVPKGCVLLHGGQPLCASLPAAWGEIEVKKV